MSVRGSFGWIAAASVCALTWSCVDSSQDGGGAGGSAGMNASSGAGGAHASGGTGQSGNASQGGSAIGGAAHGGNAGADQGGSAGELGDAGQGGQVDQPEGGAAGEGGDQGQPEGPAVFNPWALWPMPNPASAGLPHPASYDTATPGVVIDQVTGLIWQATVSTSSYNWADAKTYCAKLRLAGFSDWRLPSRIELTSLVDFTIAEPGPVIDASAFPNAPNTIFWTASTQALYGTARAWYIEFDNGFPFTEQTTVQYSARCVR